MMALKKELKVFKIILVLFICTNYYNCYAQASWNGKFYFNLKDCKGNVLTVDDIKKKEIFFYSFNSENEKIKFDIENNSFVISSHFISETRTFYVTSKKDTLKIIFPAINGKALFIKEPIKFKNSEVSFISPVIVDFLINNNSTKLINDHEIYYLPNEIIKNDLDEEEHLHIKKHQKKFSLIPLLIK
ncbi:hypothetical protein PJJ26_00595 (plasmid) [Tenacibaculum finnmarkense]|uniref:hypothetical protein n=2 Tax=Tenacibaculum TaxID=104267 RepID=UPI001F1ACFB0|nr:hypothetical protein [Tenacibaculum ovolyticum]WCC41154.1 hypothetical protein PJJ26_00595 [Tenacibaculum finnmarkense]